MNCAPITLFVYKRPLHTRQTVEALQSNEFAGDSDLIIYSDAPKDQDAVQGVREVREYIRTVDGFRSVTVIEREENFGLAQSIISGVSEVVNRYGRIIVLEDDLVTSPFFLRYMNEALELYRDDEKVASVHGYLYPVRKKLPETFFIKGADCWGWATWKRGWDLFEPDGNTLLEELRSRRLTKQFDYGETYPYTAMLQNQILGANDSWAIRWYASAFINDMLTLYPHISLVRNIGLDSSGTHCDENDYHETELAAIPVTVMRQTIEENRRAFQELKRYFRSLRSEKTAREKSESRVLLLASWGNRMGKIMPPALLRLLRMKQRG